MGRESERVSEWTSKWASYIVGLQFGTKNQLFFSVGSEWYGFKNAQEKLNRVHLLFFFLCVHLNEPKIWNGIATSFCDHWRWLVYGFVCKRLIKKIIGWSISVHTKTPKFWSVWQCTKTKQNSWKLREKTENQGTKIRKFLCLQFDLSIFAVNYAIEVKCIVVCFVSGKIVKKIGQCPKHLRCKSVYLKRMYLRVLWIKLQHFWTLLMLNSWFGVFQPLNMEIFFSY